MVYGRGAWVWCYGILLHAWNASFLVVIAASKGRLLKIDECTSDRVRLDYARHLITTRLLGEINNVDEFWIDGKKFMIWFAEDLEFGLDEDVCLVEYEDEKGSHCSESVCLQEDEPLVENLVNQIQAGWSQELLGVNQKKQDVDLLTGSLVRSEAGFGGEKRKVHNEVSRENQVEKPAIQGARGTSKINQNDVGYPTCWTTIMN